VVTERLPLRGASTGARDDRGAAVNRRRFNAVGWATWFILGVLVIGTIWLATIIVPGVVRMVMS
jgi:hypothetical protein